MSSPIWTRVRRHVAARLVLSVVTTVPLLAAPTALAAQPSGVPNKAALPELTAPVNDFAGVVDEASKVDLSSMIRSLQQKTGDAVAVATVRSVAPYPDIRDYAVDLFENHGRGIGAKGNDTGALVLLSVDDRKVWIEVGYGLEGFITDGFAGETSRQYMIPFFRQGQYGAGLKAGVGRLIARIAQERNVALDDLPTPTPVRPRSARRQSIPFPLLLFIAIILLRIIARSRGGRRGPRYWGGGPWSGWSGGVGPFGGSYGGWSSGGGGFSGGGFGGFGGGRSGGGGGGGSW